MPAIRGRSSSSNHGTISTSRSTILAAESASSFKLAASLYARAPVGVGCESCHSSLASARLIRSRPAPTAASVSKTVPLAASRRPPSGVSSGRFSRSITRAAKPLGMMPARRAGRGMILANAVAVSPGVTVARPSRTPERFGTGSTRPRLKIGVAA